jgi:uncharacterized protein YbjT (DUF2867 family)
VKIVVIGGTGLIGSKVVANLKQKGHEALAAAPNTGVNTIPDDVHVVDRNASGTNPAKFLVFLIKDKGAPALVPVE